MITINNPIVLAKIGLLGIGISFEYANCEDAHEVTFRCSWAVGTYKKCWVKSKW